MKIALSLLLLTFSLAASGNAGTCACKCFIDYPANERPLINVVSDIDGLDAYLFEVPDKTACAKSESRPCWGAHIVDGYAFDATGRYGDCRFGSVD